MNDIIKEKFQEIERLSSKIDVILESISFWEARMNKCFAECDEIEENQWLPNLNEKRELDILDESIAKLYKEIISSEV